MVLSSFLFSVNFSGNRWKSSPSRCAMRWRDLSAGLFRRMTAFAKLNKNKLTSPDPWRTRLVFRAWYHLHESAIMSSLVGRKWKIDKHETIIADVWTSACLFDTRLTARFGPPFHSKLQLGSVLGYVNCLKILFFQPTHVAPKNGKS